MTAQAKTLTALGPQSAVVLLLLLLLLFAAFTASALTPVAPRSDAAAARQTSRTSQAAAASCESLYPGMGELFRCQMHVLGSSNLESDCIPPSLVCDGVADCVNAWDEALCDFVTSGQEISLRAAAFPNYALNCYCTSRCLFFSYYFSCKAAHCPGGGDSGCADSYARFKIQVPGANGSTVIRSGDAVGLLYNTAYRSWLSCKAGKCDSQNCPGFNVARINQGCTNERFVIMLADDSEAARRCLSNPRCVQPPIRRGSRVVLKHVGGFLLAPEENGQVRVGGCGLIDSEILAKAVTDCPKNVWKIFA